MTLKQRLGSWLIPRLPVNPWVFRTFRVELNAMLVRLLHRLHPGWIARRRSLMRKRGVLANIGCGPFGLEGWVNLDLFPAPGVTMRADCRYGFPLGDGAARGIHVEHYFEHLEPGGILRIVVPDMRKYAEAYLAPGWGLLNEIGCGGERPESTFATKMEAILSRMFAGIGTAFLLSSSILRNAGSLKATETVISISGMSAPSQRC